LFCILSCLPPPSLELGGLDAIGGSDWLSFPLAGLAPDEPGDPLVMSPPEVNFPLGGRLFADNRKGDEDEVGDRW